MKKILHILSLACWATCIISCVDQITLDSPDIPDSGILIQGNLLVGPVESTGEVNIAELYKYDKNLPKRLGGAKVVLENEAGQRKEFLSSGDGTYHLKVLNDNPEIPIKDGQQYRLSVSFPNGNKYHSEWEPLLTTPKNAAIDIDIINKEYVNVTGELQMAPYVALQLSTGLTGNNGNRLHLLWQLNQAYKITQNPGPLTKTCFAIRPLLEDVVPVFDGNLAASDTIRKYVVTETAIDYRFAEGYYFLLDQLAISENTFNYFNELNQILARKGTFFDAPAGAIRTNIVNENDPTANTYGFFYIGRPETSRLYVSPVTAGSPGFRCPLPPSISGEPPPKNSCDDCLCEPGGQLDKPDWWIE